MILSMTENEVARETVDAAYRIHSVLGPGLLESVYQTVLAGELRKRGLGATAQQPIPVVFEGTRFEMGFRADLVVEDMVIVEIKSVAEIAAVHKKQLLSYLRLSDKRLGLLINFNVALIQGRHHADRERFRGVIYNTSAKPRFRWRKTRPPTTKEPTANSAITARSCRLGRR